VNAKPLILEKITSSVLSVILIILWLDTFKRLKELMFSSSAYFTKLFSVQISPVELFIKEFFKCDENEDDPNDLEDSEDDTCDLDVSEPRRSIRNHAEYIHCSLFSEFSPQCNITRK